MAEQQREDHQPQDQLDRVGHGHPERVAPIEGKQTQHEVGDHRAHQKSDANAGRPEPQQPLPRFVQGLQGGKAERQIEQVTGQERKQDET
jgi:hypothetical protein